MKPLFIVLTVLSSLFANYSFATEDINPTVLKSFNRTFREATVANWTVNENIYRVEFSLGGQEITAYFDSRGYLISTIRNINSLQLPVLLQAEIKNKYETYWITNLCEVSGESGTHYYMILENADTKIVLKSHSYAGWSVQDKTEK